MPKKNRPRRGSMGFRRKRAARIYSRVSSWPYRKEAVMLGFAGWKAGMTHVQYTETNPNSPVKGRKIIKPVTIIDSPALFVCALRFYSVSSEYCYGPCVCCEKWCENLPKELKQLEVLRAKKIPREESNASDITMLVATQPTKSGMKKHKPDLFEVAVGGTFEEKKKYAESMLGREVSVRDVFKPGEIVDISAVTKGHGFTGPVKRFGIKIQTRKNEQHRRHVGAHGVERPGKTPFTVPAAGQFGFFNRTELNKPVLMIGDNPKKITPKGGFLGYSNIPEDFILIEGSVPGPKKRLIRMRKALRIDRPRTAPDISFISLDSKQGG